MGVVTEAIKARAEEQRRLLGRLPRIREELQAQLEPNREMIENLQEGLPSLLAAVAIGEKDPSEVDKVKAESRQLTEQTADIELAVKGLVIRERQLTIRTSTKRVGFMLNEGRELERFMDSVRSGDTSHAHRLAKYGDSLGVMDVVDKFIEEAKSKGVEL
ncbi:MAG: hypothetical protein BA869_01455 [Desulfuromonadales bacterium C00003107]|nr:MAG: hypothetical protein BA869_01455 [Desulfuromonadales bacterium C00003107]